MTTENDDIYNVMITNQHGSLSIRVTYSVASNLLSVMLDEARRISIPDVDGVIHIISGDYLAHSYIRVEQEKS